MFFTNSHQNMQTKMGIFQKWEFYGQGDAPFHFFLLWFISSNKMPNRNWKEPPFFH